MAAPRSYLLFFYAYSISFYPILEKLPQQKKSVRSESVLFFCRPQLRNEFVQLLIAYCSVILWV